MTRTQHVVIGIALGGSVAMDLTRMYENFGYFDGFLFITCAVLGSVLPDIDTRIKLKHRGFTHSLTALLAVYGVYTVTPALLIVPLAGTLVGVVSHILMDMFTKAGCQFLWPLPYRVGLPRKIALTSGSLTSWVICLAIVAATIQRG